MKYVYGLKEPGNGLIHYVGLTKHPDIRLSQHQNCSFGKNAKLQAWLSICPVIEMIILEEVNEHDGRKCERKWINDLINLGLPIVNIRNKVANLRHSIIDAENRMNKHPDAEAIDRVGLNAIQEHFGVTRQAVSYWRYNGVPKPHRKTLAMLGAVAGHEMPEMREMRDRQSL